MNGGLVDRLNEANRSINDMIAHYESLHVSAYTKGIRDGLKMALKLLDDVGVHQFPGDQEMP